MWQDNGEGPVSRPPQGFKRHKKASKCYRAIPYTERYVSEDLPDLWHRLDSIYHIFEAYQRHYHQARWAECCLCFESMTHVGALGHPASKTISIKALMEREHIYSREELRRFMVNTLPKNEDGAILLPQVNMKHPTLKKTKESPSQTPQETALPKATEVIPEKKTYDGHYYSEESTKEQPCDVEARQQSEISGLKVGIYLPRAVSRP